jgi:hypothetical protein
MTPIDDRQYPPESAAKTLGVLVLMLIALHLAVGAKVALPTWRVTQEHNAALEEAFAWRDGRLDLQVNRYEVAPFGDKYYNVVGLAFTLISFLGTSLSQSWGAPAGELYSPLYLAIVAVPLPLIAFWAFGEVTRSKPWAAVWTFYLIAGTCLLPVLATCGTGSIYYINHVLSVIGLLLIGGDLLGSRQIWPAAIGLLLAAWSRQMTAFYAIPLVWLSLRSASPVNTGLPTPRLLNWIAISTVAVMVALPGVLNWLKFGNPLNTGYQLLYEGRFDAIAMRAKACFFGFANVSMHAWAAIAQLPRLDVRGGGLYLDVVGTQGVSIWLTNPLLFAVILTLRQWWRDPAARGLMLTTILVAAADVCYHTTGSTDAGYYRYALDYLPVWLLVISKHLRQPAAREWVLLAIAYSCLYFRILG